MIDLKVNLDGSLTKEDVLYLADMQRIELPENYEDLLCAANKCKNVREYLKYFDFPLSLLQNVDAIEYAMYSLTCRLAKLGLLYAEIRFAPALHIKNYLTQERVIKAALRGLYKGLYEYPDFNANLVLVCMREFGLETNMITCKHAINYHKDNKIVGIDLAGNERVKPVKFFENVFKLAKQHKLPFIIHAGETRDAQEVIDAVELGASRISHGLSLALNQQTAYYLYSHNVTLEFCPTQNIDTKVLPDYESCPIKQSARMGMKATICSGNLTISKTNINQEYSQLIKHLNLRKEDIYEYLAKAIQASFLSVEEKGQLINKLVARFDGYFNSII
ncbi:MAG: hypothetical protein J5618_00220 [Bacilli bacterium]|nr:hypothetical protein [Bacilli bacterium]